MKRKELIKIEEILLAMEYTGIYVQQLERGWQSKGGILSIVPATKVSDLLGGQLGWEEKTDNIYSRRLAEYSVRFRDKIEL